MHRLFPATQVTAVAVIVLLLLTGSAFAINNPIPGVDIIVRKHPGGIKVGTTKTDDNGTYKFEGLEAGDYELEFPGASISTSRSNIKKPGIVNGVEVHVIDVEFGTEKETKRPVPLPFSITGKKGAVSGVITKAAPKK